MKGRRGSMSLARDKKKTGWQEVYTYVAYRTLNNSIIGAPLPQRIR